jgi:hypothetical protein
MRPVAGSAARAVAALGVIAAVMSVAFWWQSAKRAEYDLARIAPVIEERLPAWTAMWRQAIPGFDLGQFRMEREGAITADREYYVTPYDPNDHKGSLEGAIAHLLSGQENVH